jgi:dipeptidyl aminopeptidase/acylaminoacyl peptidase
LTVVGCSDEQYGTRIWALDSAENSVAAAAEAEPSSHPPRLIYAHAEDAQVGPLSADDALLVIAHNEHGDARHPALRVLRIADGEPVADLWDGEGLGLEPQDFAPPPGDHRLLVTHERRGRQELLIWDPLTGHQQEVDLGLEGEVSGAEWYPEGDALLVTVDHHARSRAHRVTLDPFSITRVSPAAGSVLAAAARPAGGTWMLWSSAAHPPTVVDASGAVVLTAPGRRAPGSVPVEDLWVQGPGGPIHVLLRRPVGPAGPLPLIFDVHGGPTWHNPDAFSPYVAAWVDHGFAVAQVNYRGSTGYGSAWRDANEAAVGRIELADVVAVRDHLVAAGVADPARIVLQGASWGGYLTLLGLGLYPDLWAAGIAAVPVADYVAAYQDESEGLKAFDRSLFGGSPAELPEVYRTASPISYLDAVTAPVLILAGVNDSRCPLRQIENYVAGLERRAHPHQVYRFEAGHGSLVDAEQIRQLQTELAFITRTLPRP